MFNRRVWINPEGKSSTGSIVVFDGKSSSFGNISPEQTTFVEISDCHGKVCLHQGKFDTREEFVGKVRLLRDVLDEFIDHLVSS